MPTIAKYKFPSSDAAYAACNNMPSSGCCTRYGDVVEISSDCPDPGLAAQVCIANGGVPY